MYALSVTTGSFSTPKPEVHFLCGGDAVFKPLSTNDPTLCVSYLFSKSSMHTRYTFVVTALFPRSLCALNQGQQLAVAVGFKQRPKLNSSDGLLIFPDKMGKISSVRRHISIIKCSPHCWIYINCFLLVFFNYPNRYLPRQ